jgi:prepilin-type N-terminal cleavage/methylation domain-containing protein
MPATDRQAGLGEAGFTLLETMIAMAIMMVAFASILMVESSSINTSVKAKQMNVVTMLAKNLMVETEYSFEGKTFDEYKKEESGTFPEPYQDYSWKREVKEVKFPDLGSGSAKASASDKSGDAAAQDEASRQLTKLLTQFLSKATREVTVTIKFKRGSGEQSYSIATYWVNLNHEFQLSE